MKKILLAVFIFSLATSVSALAQSGITVSVTPNVDTCAFNATLTYTLKFFNNDTVNFNGSLAAKATVNGFPHGDLISASPLPIAAGDSITFTGMNLAVTSAAFFLLGDNVVVIWPVAMTSTDTIVGDTIHKRILVIWPDGFIDPSLLNKIFVTPTSANNFQIHNLTSVNISQSNIYDLSGKLMMKNEGDKTNLLLSDFASGLYLLEVKLANGKRAMFKLSVQ